MSNKTEVPGIFRDPKTGALLNKDHSALVAYKKKKMAKKMLNERLNKLEEDVAEIKELLKKVLDDNR